MAELLSQKIEIGSFVVYPKSIKSILSQTAWHVVVVAATYYASAEEIETMGCFLDAHEIKFFPKRKAYPEVLFLSSIHYIIIVM
jgi:hypothetical protein